MLSRGALRFGQARLASQMMAEQTGSFVSTYNSLADSYLQAILASCLRQQHV